VLPGPWEQWLCRSLGSSPVAGVERLAGGSKKGVYRVHIDDGTTAVLYSWDSSENYWPAAGSDPTDPFAEASGAALFRDGYDALRGLDVGVPQLLAFDDTTVELPFAAAVVEDITGGSLEACLAPDPDRAATALGKNSTRPRSGCPSWPRRSLRWSACWNDCSLRFRHATITGSSTAS
jgi:hypothetical protein